MSTTNLHNIDCLEFMKTVPDKFYDLAIVDPPYGINAPKMQMGSVKKRNGFTYNAESTANKIRKGRLNAGGGKLKNRILNRSNVDWDNAPPDESYFNELFRISKHQIIWGGNYFNLPPTRGIVVWDKLQPWENFSQAELAWTSFDKPAAMYRQSTTGGANAEKKIHATQKPIELYGFLLNKYAKEGYKILDTHFGSGSSIIACERLGFDIDACEIDTNMFNKASERINLCRQQLILL